MGDTDPEHMTWIGTAFEAYCRRETPARSLPAEEHHLHRKATIFGSFA
jgi:hypothetical protein